VKKLYFISTILIFAAVFGGCQKETPEKQSGISSQKGYSEITAYFADAQTKTVLDETDNASVLWNFRDQIIIYYNSARIKFTSTNPTPSRSATFVSEYNLIFGGLGDSEETKSGKPIFYGIYPYSDENQQSNKSDNIFQIYVSPFQKGIKGSFARASFPAVGRSSDTNMAFYNVCGGICFSLTQSGVQYVTVEGNSSEMLAGYARVTINDNGLPSSSLPKKDYNSSRVTLVAPSKEGFEVGQTYYISMFPNTFSNGITMTFHKTDAVASLSIARQLEIKRSTFGRITSADQGLDYVPVDPAVEEVDLGLTVNWATCNVGAIMPEEAGTFFAFGDTEGQKWDGAAWSNNAFSYAPYSDVDSFGILLPQYDAATVNLGEHWRMPTKDEYQELLDNTQQIWTDNYENFGVSGLILESTVSGYEDKHIFLPASGRGYLQDIFFPGQAGYYWTSTINYGVIIEGDYCGIKAYNRRLGFSIRPVSAETKAAITL